MSSTDSATVVGPESPEPRSDADDLFDDLGATPEPEAVPSLLPRRRRRRAAIWVPILLVVAVVAAYCGTTLFWSIDAIAPQVTATTVTPVAASKATITWPKHGGGAIAVPDFDSALVSDGASYSMASITKLVTVLTVLQHKPITSGEGARYHFTAKDHKTYIQFLKRNESALDVPVNGSLTQYQMLEGILIGSASNYATRLVHDTFGSNRAFVDAAMKLLGRNGISGITIVDPTGFERGNKATPAALMKLASLAMGNTTIAAIVQKPEVVLPGAGHVTNTNGLIRDAGVNGLKTGTLVGYDLLAAKTVHIGSVTTQVYALSLYQPSEDARNAQTRALFNQVAKQLKVKPSVTSGTTVGEVRTAWGETVPVVTTANAGVVLWNGASAQVSTTFPDLGDKRAKGELVGSLTTTGPLDSAKVDVALGADIEPPTAWWRLTHPLELWGLQPAQ